MVMEELLIIAKIGASVAIGLAVGILLSYAFTYIDILVFIPSWLLSMIKAAVSFTAASSVYKLIFG